MVLVPADDAALAREEWLAGRPGWVLVWGVHGPERDKRIDGRGGTMCACKKRDKCASAGKHPWTGAGAVVGGPTGTVVPLTLGEAREASWPGVRLAAWLAPGERVLDADSHGGLSELWRAWPEVMNSWLLVRTRRGLHCWQREGGRPGDGEGVRFRGGDIKTRGVVVWADGRNRRVMDRVDVRDWLTRLHESRPGDGVVVRARESKAAGDGWEGLDQLDRGSARALLLGAARALRDQSEGSLNRNHFLNWAGWTAGRRALSAGLDLFEVQAILGEAARDCGLEEGEIVATLRSSLRGSEVAHPLGR